jgi:hypothetical protein
MVSTDIIDGLPNSKRKAKNLFAKLFNSTSTRGAGVNRQCKNNAPSKVKLVIYHRLPGVELISPVYACNGAKRRLSPYKRVITGSTAQASFSIDPTQDASIGILMYELRRRNAKQFNKSAIFSEDEARRTQIFIIWKINSSEEFCAVSSLIEHDKSCVWDRDRLMKLAKWYKPFDVQHGPIELAYLMRDNTVLMTRVNVTREKERYKLEMTISEGSIKYDTQRPDYIDLDR